MKLKEYAKMIQAYAKKHPDINVVYSSDDEGNNFQMVHYAPSTGMFNNGEFLQHDETQQVVNCICIN